MFIVVVPMIAMAVVLFLLIGESQRRQTDSMLFQAQVAVQQFDADLQAEAGQVAETIGRDQRLANARADEDEQAIQARLDALADETGAAFVHLNLNTLGDFRAGSPPAMAPDSRRLLDAGGDETGRVTVAMLSADQYVERVVDYTDAEVVLENEDGRRLATTSPNAPAELPDEPGSGVEVDGTEYRIRTLQANAVGGPVEVALLLDDRGGTAPTNETRNSILAATVFIVFIVLAFVFAVALSRRLQSEIQRLLEAARQLGGGDFSVAVPAEDDDEFGELGKEFNSMARQLEARLEDLQRERGRLQEAIRRVGESVAAGLDRRSLLEIVVQTAVDGTGASAGRAHMRGPDGRLEEMTSAGEPQAFQRALHAAEAAVIDAGQIAEVHLGDASALAAPLGTEEGHQLIGIVSVVRGDRQFTDGERELLAYLTNQASVSVENVDLHETVQRQALTDELTGLFNHRRFQEVMTGEVESARRYNHELGLIMLDIDNFKQVNDAHGHLQGDMVLGEVARVLRQSSRDVDEPARYGGEEMAVALPHTDLEGSYQFAERVRRRIEALELPLLNGGGALRVTASFGVASLATAGTADKDALVAAADGALYEAKRAGKNRTVRASVNAGLQRDVHGVASGE